MSHLSASRATAPQQRTILAHSERVAPLIAHNFPNVPLVFSYYPRGLGTEPTFSTSHDALPQTVPHVSAAIPMVTPCDWSELDTRYNGTVTASNAAARIAEKGDLFAALHARLAHERFSDVHS